MYTPEEKYSKALFRGFIFLWYENFLGLYNILRFLVISAVPIPPL